MASIDNIFVGGGRAGEMKGDGVKEREEPKHEEGGNNVGHSYLTLNAEETNSAPVRTLGRVWRLKDQPETWSG